MTKEYQRILCDIDIILEHVGQTQREKIPKKLRDMIHNNKLPGYVSNINPKVPIEKQELQQDTKAFLAMLYLNYWCETQEEKDSLKRKLQENQARQDAQIREKYNPDNIFKNPKEQSNNMQMVEYHESWFKKFTQKLINMFRRKNV